MIDRDAFRHVTALQLAQALALKTGPRPRPNRLTAYCVWHSEKRPSMDLASKDHGVAGICRSCGAKGDHFAIAGAVWGLDPSRGDFRTIALRLGEALGIDPDAPDSSRGRRRARTEDPIVALAQRVDAMADDFINGRSARDADVRFVSSFSADDGIEALAILRATDAPPSPTPRASRAREREAEFERMAEHFQEWGWTHSARIEGHELDLPGAQDGNGGVR